MNRIPILLLTLAFALMACEESGTSSESTASTAPSSEPAATAATGTMASVAVDEFAKRLSEDPNAILVDVRTEEERQTDGIIDMPGVEALHWDFMGEEFQQQMLEADPDVHVYVYCASGGRSARTGEKLVEMGVKEVYNLNGGIGAWKSSGHSITQP